MVIKMLFSDLFKIKNKQKEKETQTQSENQLLLQKAQEWLDDRDNYSHNPNITISVQTVNKNSESVFSLYGGFFQIYGPTILDGYRVTLYPKKNHFLEIWESTDSTKNSTVYLMKNNQILKQMDKNKFIDLCTVWNWSSKYNNNLNSSFEMVKLLKYNDIIQVFNKVEYYERKHKNKVKRFRQNY